MRFSPGCGCCCVDLHVDDDNTSKWDRETDAYGVETITVLQSVDICNFIFGIKFATSTPGSGSDQSIDIYFLDDPTDANVDAAGSIEITVNYDPAGASNEPFFVAGPASFPYADGTLVFDISDLGISQTVNHNMRFAGITFASHDEKFLLDDGYVVDGSGHMRWNQTGGRGIDGMWFGTTTGMDTLDNLSIPLVLDRSACSAKQRKYIRIVLGGDTTLPLAGAEVQFRLESINDVGDQSCRTDSTYYTAGTEEGNCLTPPVDCNEFPTGRNLFLEIEYDWPDEFVSSGDAFGIAWLVKGDGIAAKAGSDPRCTCRAEFKTDDSYGDVRHSWIFEAFISCDSGIPLLTVRIYHGYAPTFGFTWCEWEIELDYSVTEPKDIPQTVLTDANKSDTSNPGTGFPSNVSFTINP